MIRRITFSVVMAYLLLMLTACGGGRSGEMAALLDRADSLNRAYVPMTDGIDSLLLEATKYYDRHGTANQQMRAHYLLGCAYRDMGEAPAALQSYQDAVDRADTLSSDCDYQRLMAVYGQMSELYDAQNLPNDELNAIFHVHKCANLIEDTLTSIRCVELQVKPYFLLGDTASMLRVLEESRQLYLSHGYKQEAASVFASVIDHYLSKGKIDEAGTLMKVFEEESGLFDDAGNIDHPREIYYYMKGTYFLKKKEYEKAEYYYRKLRETHEMEACRGLVELYRIKGVTDSLIKYTFLFESALDTLHNKMRTDVVHQMTSMYNYQRFLKKADAESRKAERFNLYFLVSVFSFVVLVLITFVAGYVLVQKKRRLEERIELLRGYAVNQNLRDSPIAQQFRELLKTNPYHQPELKDWKELSAVIDREAPHFHKTLCQGDVQLSDFEYDVCMLIKIQIPLSDIARLKQCVPSYITQTRKHIFQKLFKKKGRADELDEYIMKLL